MTERLDNPWSTRSGTSTWMTYAPDGILFPAARLRFHDELIEAHRAASEARTDGTLAVIVTAGPPGAGKSTALDRYPELSGYRSIDADDFKDPLLARAREEGLLEAWLGRILQDGRPVAPRELSNFVHAESTVIADAYRQEAFRLGENAIIHGTLSYAPMIDDLLEELDGSGYERLVVVDVEVPEEQAIEQARARWWKEREDGSDPMGGRFVPRDAIRSYYAQDAARSISWRNARDLAERARALDWDVRLDVIEPA